MSENENENANVTQGNGTAGWGWEPVPQGGEYDSDATAFVKLPQDMLDALGTGEPLAAPGHGYVPPPMIVPLGSATTDPAATGTWTIPVQWPEAGGSAPAGSAPAAGSGPGSGSGSVGGPIPASIPIPASVAAAFAEAEPEQPADPGATGEWRFPQAAQEPETAASATGQWAVPEFSEFPGQQGDFRQGGLDADWSQAPATLPGGAPAPWAYLTQQPAGDPDGHLDGSLDAGVLPGVLPGTDEAAAASAAAATATAHGAGRLLGGPGVGAAGRGPRVLGGPGVGTPLPEGEPVHPAPHDIDAAHGPAAEQAEGSRTADHTDHAEPAGYAGRAGHGEHMAQEHLGYAGHAAHVEPGEHGEHTGHAAHVEPGEHGEHTGHAAHVEPGEHGEYTGHAGHAGHTGHGAYAGHVGPTRHAGTDGRGFTAFGEAPEPGGATEDAAAQPVASGGLDLFGGVRAEAPAGAEPGQPSEPPQPAEPAQPGGTDGHGFAAFGHAAPEPGPAPEPEIEAEVEAVAHEAVAHDAVPGAETGLPEPGTAAADAASLEEPAAAETPADHTPGADTADSGVALPDAGTGRGIPAEVPTYEEGTADEAVAHHEHPQASYVLRVNGADRPVTGAWIGESLLYVLRERLGLAGAKDGCSQGECGACAVQVDGRLVASCLVPAATAAGSEVRTVEGLATNGELSDVQQALCRSGAVQCGFCVPGMAMTIHDLLEGNHAPSELETRQALCGNLCRCSGYAGVVDAVREVVAEREAAAADPTAQGEAQGQAPAAGHAPEARIPHQAAPGEGGIHHGGTA
ncbi:2Fe-2S iron-sulfur cluster-binding protein [Streptomyces sp. NRRL F-2580]|uniref:2Fe-2S iron-sulfur cluster-binding protein n=1 Tax=Streptomyces sp. NRRL F-2580 TaxID=1463841 RepID=UPI0006895957|nr:2Fe-2S iron-sulfur cluster-binding protein [Streptomyces sp. NRRL F-2580]